jgi:site-specific recombinase XerD
VAIGATVDEETIMDPCDSEVEVPRALSLDGLCAGAHHELLMRGYSRRTVNRYMLVWQHLAEFAREHNLGNDYSRNLAMRFEEVYGLREGERLKPTERWRRHLVFALTILDDYAHAGSIMRFVVERSGLRIPPAMQKPMHDYEQFAKERRHLRMSSLQERMHSIAVFLDFLRSRGVMTLDQIQAEDISAFITSRSCWKPRTVYHAASDVRLFLQFLFLRDILPRDFSSVVPTIRVARHDTIPSVWDQELVAKLLDAVDRNLPRGKRDFAILLLAARLGMRLGDIRTLRLDDLKWAAATIEIAQGKTGAPLVLPMSEEVGLALIDYLKSVRPCSPHREVFLHLTPPFEPFSEKTHLHHVVKYWRELAGIQFRSKQHQGLHSLRHTLATRLLHEQTPFHIISAVLGHASSATTFIYAKADVEMLRSAALNT